MTDEDREFILRVAAWHAAKVRGAGPNFQSAADAYLEEVRSYSTQTTPPPEPEVQEAA